MTDDTTPCLTLGLTLLIGPVDEYPVALRLSRDAAGTDLILTNEEARKRAEERVAELEMELAKKATRA